VHSRQKSRPWGERLPGSALVAGLLLLVLLSCYGDTGGAPLLLDDEFTLVRNRSVHHLGDVAAVLRPPADSPTGGRPLSNLTFALTYAVSGREPWAHRVFNVFLHGAAALLIFGVVRRALALPSMPDELRAQSFRLGAATALIWAAHPLQTQCVTYISQRTESLMAACYLLTLYSFIRAQTEPDRAGAWRVVSVLACWMGSLSKESIATAPLAVLLFHWMFMGVGFRELLRRHWGYYAALAVAWLFLADGLRDVDQRGVSYGAGVTARDYAVVQVKAVLEYLRLSLWPHPLVFDRSPLVVMAPRLSLPHAAALVALLGLTLWGLWRRSRWAFFGGWFFLVLAPTSSVIPVVNAAVAENRAYLPSVAVVAGVVVGLGFFLPRNAARLAYVALGATAAWATHARNLDYADAITLWTDTVEKAPGNPRAHGHLGFALYAQGHTDAALRHYREALRMDPERAAHHTGTGVILAQMPGGLEAARHHLSEALRLKPDEAEAHANLGTVLSLMGRDLKVAEWHLREALRLSPDDAGAWFLFGEFAERRRADLAEARGAYRESLRLRAGFEPARQALQRVDALVAAFGLPAVTPP
jgi:tetratricopeptide (TPR) repeat protein